MADTSISPQLPPLSRRIRLRHLELLAALGEHASLKHAAEMMGMSQPAASKLLLEAESLVGTTLYERSNRGVLPTAAGAALVLRAQRFLGLVDGLGEEVQVAKRGAKGRVRVGVSPACGAVIPGALAAMRAAAQDVVLRIEEGSSASLLERLRDGRLDCVLGRVLDSQDLEDFDTLHLYNESIVMVAEPQHPIFSKSTVDWEDALSYEWVLPPQGAPLRRTLAFWLARQGFQEPRCLLESTLTLANLAVLRENQALVLLGSISARQFSEQGVVRVVPLPFDGIALPSVSLFLPQDDYAHESVDIFIRALEQHVRETLT
ncbi:MAG TPA: LysR family transcriptional regulator [Alcaligenes faecalis]|nr:LysR substrate-binding domain-containing protein [Alcaligenes faecalis]HJE64639.1 LysR family transcriptional regulator [Alcaligenes faecalis]